MTHLNRVLVLCWDGYTLPDTYVHYNCMLQFYIVHSMHQHKLIFSNNQLHAHYTYYYQLYNPQGLKHVGVYYFNINNSNKHNVYLVVYQKTLMHTTIYFYFFHTISVTGRTLATSLYCVSQCFIYYGWDRSCGTWAEDFLAEQIKFLPHKLPSVVAECASLWYPPQYQHKLQQLYFSTTNIILNLHFEVHLSSTQLLYSRFQESWSHFQG